MIMHIVCFVALLASRLILYKHDNIMIKILSKFLEFITVPYYLYMVLDTQYVLRTALLNYREVFKNLNTDLKLDVNECLAGITHGHAIEWMRIELIAFYARIFQMILFLLLQRLSKQQPSATFEI